MEQSSVLPLVSRSVKVWHDEHAAIEQAAVVFEEPLIIMVNGQQVAALMRLPGNERELAAGFLVSEGILRDFSAVYTISHCGSEPASITVDSDHTGLTGRNRVDVQADADLLNPGALTDVLHLVRSGCGEVQVQRNTLQHPPLNSPFSYDAAILVEAARSIRGGQSVHSQAGGAHVAGVFAVNGECIVLREDIGRHNAVDKACGFCLLNQIPLDDKLLLCSGRLSYEMVNKALNLGIAVIASISAPTELALQLAEVGNVTVVGYLRGSRMTVYTHPERISFPADGTVL